MKQIIIICIGVFAINAHLNGISALRADRFNYSTESTGNPAKRFSTNRNLGKVAFD